MDSSIRSCNSNREDVHTLYCCLWGAGERRPAALTRRNRIL